MFSDDIRCLIKNYNIDKNRYFTMVVLNYISHDALLSPLGFLSNSAACLTSSTQTDQQQVTVYPGSDWTCWTRTGLLGHVIRPDEYRFSEVVPAVQLSQPEPRSAGYGTPETSWRSAGSSLDTSAGRTRSSWTGRQSTSGFKTAPQETVWTSTPDRSSTRI